LQFTTSAERFIDPFISMPQVALLMDRVEEIFTEHFTGGHRRQAMAALRPMQQPASHHVTYFLGTEIILNDHGGVFLCVKL
jgi:hypothetical protein